MGDVEIYNSFLLKPFHKQIASERAQGAALDQIHSTPSTADSSSNKRTLSSGKGWQSEEAASLEVKRT